MRGGYLADVDVDPTSGNVFAPGYQDGPVIRFDSGGNFLGIFSFTSYGSLAGLQYDSNRECCSI